MDDGGGPLLQDPGCFEVKFILAPSRRSQSWSVREETPVSSKYLVTARAHLGNGTRQAHAILSHASLKAGWCKSSVPEVCSRTDVC